MVQISYFKTPQVEKGPYDVIKLTHDFQKILIKDILIDLGFQTVIDNLKMNCFRAV